MPEFLILTFRERLLNFFVWSPC